jgi:cell division protein FtsQ
VDRIEILGAERADVAGRVAGTGVGPGAIMIWVDTAAIADAVLADPWVRDARVDRVFPDRLVVEVLERRPAVWIEGTTSWMLVAGDGTVLITAEEPDATVLRAYLVAPDRAPGDRPEEAAWSEVVGMAAVLAPPLAAESRLLLEGSELWLEVPGYRVRLGAPVDLGDKALVLQELLQDDGLPFGAVIDVVAPRRPAVIPPGTSPVLDAEVEGEGDGEADPGA